MNNIIRVGMADLNICKTPNVITTLGLGSCIGLTFYDPVRKMGGMVHYMLPDSTLIRNNTNIAKFADTGIQELLKRVLESGGSSISNVGEKNAIAARKILKQLNIPLVAEDTGLDYGRTIELHCETGELYIKAIKKPVKII